MCRIVGLASKNTFMEVERSLLSMMNSVAHGGPDDEGKYVDDKIALGHKRLSIIDLSSAGHQPMFLGAQLIISFNGEIYNYQILKEELERLGVVFGTKSDTEVI